MEIVKGIHPGLILQRELLNRNISRGQFALSVHASPQTINAIITGKRDMNIDLSMRIEEALGMEEGYLMTLQVFFDIRRKKRALSMQRVPDISKFRPVLFWDTKIGSIDWQRQKKAVIQRVFESGNFSEKKETLHFYGRGVIKEILNTK